MYTYITLKESACNARDLDSTPALGRSPREAKDYPLQYSGLENSKNCIAHEVIKSQIRLSHFHFHFSLSMYSVQFSSVTQSCPTLCDPMNRSTPGLPVHNQLVKCIITRISLVDFSLNSLPLLLSKFKKFRFLWV